MSTKLYFRALGTGEISDYGTGNNDVNLRGTAIVWSNSILSTSAGSAISSPTQNAIAGPTPGLEVGSSSVQPRVWYSLPLDADITISGSITWNLWAAESAMTDNVAINGRLEVIDGATGVITLIDQTANATEIGSLSPTRSLSNFAETPAAGVACKRGDRLRARIFGDDAGTMAAGGAFTVGVNGATPGADGDSWLQLTENLTFVSEPAGTQVFPTDTASTPGLATLASSFAGADANPLSEGGNWANLDTGTSPMKLIGNAATGSSSGGCSSYWTLANYSDVDAYITLATAPTGAQGVSLACRVAGEGGSSTWDGYRVEVSTSIGPTTNLYRVLNASNAATLATTSQAFANGDKLGLSAHGSWIAVWRWPSGGSAWAFVCGATDTTYTSGKVAIGSVQTSPRLDDFYIGTGGTFPGYREAWTSRGAGVATDVTNTVTGFTAPIQVTDTAGGTVVDWFTRPLTAFTLGGAVRCNVRALVSTGSSGAQMRCEIARVAGDGTGATIWGATTFGSTAFIGTTEAAASFLVSGDDLAVSDGQRLRIRFYIDDSPLTAMVGSHTITLFYAGTSASASGDTYLTFTQTLTEFSSGPDVVPRGRIPQYAQHLAH